jgi:hypothetical protein
MSIYFRLACVVAVVLNLSASKLYSDSGPFNGKSFQGRIAYSADGNPGVSVHRGDEIVIEVQGDSAGNYKLDYLQLTKAESE